MTFKDKTDMIAGLFKSPVQETVQGGDNTPLQHGNYYGGVYNKKKYMYSQILIETLPIDKLESFIKKQISYEII